MTEWIKCTDRLPPNKEWILVARAEHVCEAFFYNDCFCDQNPGLDFYAYKMMDVTHWMPLPSLPEENL